MEVFESQDRPYSQCILDYVNARPACLSELSDRAVHSLVREGITSLAQLKVSIDSGLELRKIANIGKHEISEIEKLLVDNEPETR